MSPFFIGLLTNIYVMSKFNATSTKTATTNMAGGEAYSQSAELELASAVITSFANDTFYEKAADRFDRVSSLLDKVDPMFAAKVAVYARREFGMRSMSHVVAAELAPKLSGKAWAASFYDAIVFRPDDMMEIIAYLKAKGQKLSAALKRGFAKAFNRFDAYQLAKYRGEGKGVKLVDVANLVHPIPGEENADALRALINGELKSTDTWETRLTRAGQVEGSEGDKIEAKKEAWVEMIRSGKMGYFALLRNLRNIMIAAPEVENEVIAQLTDRNKIKKSLVLPFRYFTAITELQQIAGSRNIVKAISDAAEISLDNVPRLPGKTLIAVDVSGSMTGRPSTIAKMFGSVLYKRTEPDLLVFDGRARYVSLNPADSILSLMDKIPFSGGSTNFNSIFDTATGVYDRVIILSDMQAWVSNGWSSSAPTRSFAAYKSRTGADPIIYSFDLQGYGSMQFPERKVFCLAGFSDKIFDIMALLESDPKALLTKINEVTFAGE